MNTLTQLRLDDGRTVACLSPAEARMLWTEMSPTGSYRRAAAALHPGDIVLDIGANIGLSAMLFAGAAHGIRVLAAEPAPETFRCLQRNLSAYAPDSLAIRIAVGAAPGMLPFTWYPHASANSGLYADRHADDDATRIFLRNSGLDDNSIAAITSSLHNGQQIIVDVTTVSALLAEHGCPGDVGLLKIDVERAELDVLAGITDTDWARIRTIVAEVHDHHGRLTEFCRRLAAHGFITEARQDPALRGTELHEVYACRPTAGILA